MPPCAQVFYEYYLGGEHGSSGDLRKVTLTDGSGTIDTEYYRYYTQADETSGKPGYKGAMMYAFGQASYSRMVADLGDDEPRTDAEVAPYADSYFEYFMTHADPGRVKQHKAQRRGWHRCKRSGGVQLHLHEERPQPGRRGIQHVDLQDG